MVQTKRTTSINKYKSVLKINLLNVVYPGFINFPSFIIIKKMMVVMMIMMIIIIIILS